jgi:hypothetical protein
MFLYKIHLIFHNINEIFSSLENPSANGQEKRIDTCLPETGDLPDVWDTQVLAGRRPAIWL